MVKRNIYASIDNNKAILIAGALLFFPFFTAYIYTEGLTKGIDTIFSIDEPTYHYPTILKFAEELPYPDIRDYNSATTPLFHILLAGISKVIGTDVKTLRIVNFFITYISVLILFAILIKRFRLPLKMSFLFSLLFAFSPYFFREAFVILTDNLPILWLLCFFNFYLRYKSEKRQSLFLWSLFFVALLCLTRQTYLFVCLIVFFDTLLEKEPVQQKLSKAFFIFLSAIPTLLLFIIWRGLTPPSFIELHTHKTFLNSKPILYGFSVLGFYVLFIHGATFFKSLFRERSWKIAGWIMIIWIITFFSPLVKEPKDFGYLWHMTAYFPSLAGTSVLFYILEALGIIGLFSIWYKGEMSLFVFFILGLFVSEVPNKFVFQRYYDSGILLCLIFANAKYHLSNNLDFCRRTILIIFFITYFVVFTIV